MDSGRISGRTSGRVEEWVGEFVERREQGEALTAETFAAEHPEGGSELVEALRALAMTEALLPKGAPDLPARIGAYRVLGEIGRGGMGRVFEALHPARPEQRIALKLLHVSLEHQPRALERFRREGQALERLAHPGIVRVLEAGLLDQRPFLAMERVEGVSLAEFIRRARERSDASGGRGPSVESLELPGEGSALQRAVRLVARLARALAEAHAQGVLHRDVNPRNVLIRANGDPVLIDFGLMRSSGDPTLTGSGDLLGTPQYMASEQARGERVDERTDVFGLGTILWELFTLEPPRRAEDTLALLRSAANEPLRRRTLAAAGVPRELAVIVGRATSFFRRWRTPTCAALAADLESWLDGEPILVRPIGPLVRVLELVHHRRRAVAAAALLVLALTTAILLWFPASAEDIQARRVRTTTEIASAWFGGDLLGARSALEGYVTDEDGEAPLSEFLRALITGNLAHESRDPATRALLEGERLRQAGRGAEARARFDTAWDVSPGYPLVILLQGLASFEAGDLPAARERLEFSAYHFGSVPRLHRTLAQLYARLELWEDARRAASAALALAPDDAEAAQILTLAGEKLGR